MLNETLCNADHLHLTPEPLPPKRDKHSVLSRHTASTLVFLRGRMAAVHGCSHVGPPTTTRATQLRQKSSAALEQTFLVQPLMPLLLPGAPCQPPGGPLQTPTSLCKPAGVSGTHVLRGSSAKQDRNQGSSPGCRTRRGSAFTEHTSFLACGKGPLERACTRVCVCVRVRRLQQPGVESLVCVMS